MAYCNGPGRSIYTTFAQCVSAYGGGEKAGTAAGVGLIVVLWVVTDFLIGLTYGIYRLVRR